MQTEILDSWDIPELPPLPRSRLYNQLPMGDGTHLREALLSYSIRLANAHSVAPLILFNREIIPLTQIKLGKARSSFTSKCSKTVNSYAKYATEVSGILEQLTCREDMADGTFIYWGDTFDPKGAGMLHGHPRWCPECLHDWRMNNKTPYFPLIWYAGPVKFCLEHKRTLAETCAGCGKHQPFIPRHYHIDHCSFCGNWLGNGAEPDMSKRDFSLSRFDVFAAEAIAEMICDGKNAIGYASYEILRIRLKAYTELLANGVHREFERLVGFKQGVLTQWISRDTRPKIQQLLLLTYRLKTTPVTFLRDEIPSSVPKIDRPFPVYASRVRITLTAKQRKKLQGDLQEIVDNKSESISFKETCSRLGYTKNFLKYWFEDECRQISDNYKKYVSDRSKEKKIQAENIAYKVTLELLAEGKHLSRRFLDKVLAPHKLSQAYQEVREGVNRAKREYYSGQTVSIYTD